MARASKVDGAEAPADADERTPGPEPADPPPDDTTRPDAPAEAEPDAEKPDTDAPRTGWWRRGTLPVWLVSLLAFTLLGAGWAVAAPFNATYDEDSHIVRAAGVAYGQLRVKPEGALYNSGGYQRIPASLVPPTRNNRNCMFGPASQRPSAACYPAPLASHALVKTATTAARYNPLYYVLVGWPMRLAPDMAGIVWARVVSALLSALLLSGAFALAWRYRPSWTLPAAVLLVATPIEINLAGSINPNGLEISAAIAFWTALVVLVRSERMPDRRALRGLLVFAAVAATPLIVLRQIGPLFVLVAAGACALAARPGRLRDLVRARPVRVTAGVLTVIAVLGTAWTMTSGLLDFAQLRQGGHVPRSVVAQSILMDRSADWARQLVARFYGGLWPPDWTIYLWYLMIGAIVVPALVIAGRRLAISLLGTLGFTLVLCVVLEFKYFDAAGATQQGRYYLPLLAGVVLLAGALPAYRPRAAGRVTAIAAVLTAPTQVISLALMMTVWQLGAAKGMTKTGAWRLDPFHGFWHPATGSVLPFVFAVAGAALVIALGVTCWRVAAHRDTEPVALT